jgi:hypothetical protein
MGIAAMKIIRYLRSMRVNVVYEMRVMSWRRPLLGRAPTNLCSTKGKAPTNSTFQENCETAGFQNF